MSPRLQVQRFYDEIWNGPDLTVIPAVLHPNVSFRGSLGVVRSGHAEFADYVRVVTTALSGYTCEIQQLIAEKQAAVARMMFVGRHTGEFLGRAPTGRYLRWAGAAFFTFDDELIRDLWVLGDLVDLHAQLDLDPALTESSLGLRQKVGESQTYRDTTR